MYKRTMVALLLLSALLASCKVNREYDLKQDINARMVLARGITFPIGDVGGTIKAESLMFLIGSENISRNEDGKIVLDFTENPEFVIQFDITGFRMNQHVDFYEPVGLSLKMDIENSSPFAFDLQVALIDSTATIVPEYKSLIEGGVNSGRPGNPSKSAITVSAFADCIVPFDGLRFSFHFSGGDLAGTKYVITDDDVLAFKGLKLRFPNGFPLEPQWLDYVKPVISVIQIISLFK